MIEILLLIFLVVRLLLTLLGCAIGVEVMAIVVVMRLDALLTFAFFGAPSTMFAIVLGVWILLILIGRTRFLGIIPVESDT